MSQQKNQPEQNETPQDANELIAQRQAKLDEITATGKPAYPNAFRRTDYAQDLQTKFADITKQEIEEKATAGGKTQVNVAGRVMLNRGAFIVIQDMTGRIQLYVARKELDKDTLALIKSLDLGDIVGVSGYIGRSGKGDLYVHIEEITLLTKSLRPMPNKFHGLADVEARYRNRHLDLMTNEASRDTFVIRSQVISGIRKFMLDERFMEVETPMMHPIPGGAVARPFITHHNALDMPLYLRIAPELYLKRLVVGGFERVFEINRSFRNEGVSTRHNPEFTMIEFYQAYADYHDLMDLTERLFNQLANDILGTTELTYQEESISLKAPFARYVIEPSFGLTRSMMAFLVDAYVEDEAPNSKGGVDKRTVLKLDPRLAPVKAAVLPLSRNEELSPKAKALANELRKSWNIDFDDAGAIGRRYRRQDEIGTPFCITVDFDTLDDQAVPIRDRDTMNQERVALDQVRSYLSERLNGA